MLALGPAPGTHCLGELARVWGQTSTRVPPTAAGRGPSRVLAREGSSVLSIPATAREFYLPKENVAPAHFISELTFQHRTQLWPL